MALSATGRVVFSEVLLFLHRDQEIQSTFLTLETEHGHRLAVTAHHLVYLAAHCRFDSSEYQAQFASRAKAGVCVLIHTADGQVRPSRIVSVSEEESVGVYAPLTEAGTVFVDGVLASSYALIEDHRLAHWAFGPVRLFSSFKQLLWADTTEELSTDGKTAGTKIPLHSSTLATNDKVYVKNSSSILSESPMDMTVKHPWQRQPSDVHWYARLLYRIGYVFLTPELFHP